jgi:hypothetical protein
MGVGMVVNISTKTDGLDRGQGGRRRPKAPLGRRDVYLICALLVCCLVAGAYLGITYQPKKGVYEDEQFGGGSWLNESYKFRVQLRIENTNAAEALPAGYPVKVSIEYPALVSDGKLRADFRDLRLARECGSDVIEIPRNADHVEFDTAHVALYFQLSEPVAPGKSCYSYYVYYGNPDAGAPLASSFDVSQAGNMAPDIGFWHEEVVPEPAALMLPAYCACLLIVIIIVNSRRRT